MVQNGTNIIALDTHQHKLEFGGDTIMIELDAFKKLMEENDDRLPLLTLNEFFEGNTAEDSIAPNECGFGRPSIAEIWELMRNLEKRPDIAWIRIELHDDTEIANFVKESFCLHQPNHERSFRLKTRSSVSSLDREKVEDFDYRQLSNLFEKLMALLSHNLQTAVEVRWE